MQIPRTLLGWEYGTLVIKPTISGRNLSRELQGLRLKLQTSISVGHMHGKRSNEPSSYNWSTRRDKDLHLAVRKRYSSPLIIQFRKDRHLLDKTAAFAVLWLNDLVDDEETTMTLGIWKGDLKRATTCYLRDCGEKVGEIEITVTFAKGLDKGHTKLAKKDTHLRDVMEVVETSRYATRKDYDDAVGTVTSPKDKNFHEDGVAHPSTNDSSSDSSSDGEDASEDDNDDEHDNGGGRIVDNQLQSAGERNLRSSWKEYRKDSKQTHRRHRGVMQYKTARTMWWMKHKAENVQDRISGVFSHHERSGGVETEA